MVKKDSNQTKMKNYEMVFVTHFEMAFYIHVQFSSALGIFETMPQLATKLEKLILAQTSQSKLQGH